MNQRNWLPSLLLLFCSVTVFSQTSFRIKVIESQSGESIADAVVFIEEIPVEDKYSDRNGFVSYQNIPEDRKVRVNIRKPGYQPQQKEIVANRDLGPDNNIVIKLVRQSNRPQKIIWGEVTTQDGVELSNAKVEIILAGVPFETRSDEGGNYRFRIDESHFSGLQNFRIEASSDNCARHRNDASVPQANVSNYDLVLQCSEVSIPTKNPPSHYDVQFLEGHKLELEKCERVGNSVTCKMYITSLNKDRTISVMARNYQGETTIVDNQGNSYTSTGLKLGGKFYQTSAYGKDLYMDVRTPLEFQFSDVSSSASNISVLKVDLSTNELGFTEVKFRSIVIE